MGIKELDYVQVLQQEDLARDLKMFLYSFIPLFKRRGIRVKTCLCDQHGNKERATEGIEVQMVVVIQLGRPRSGGSFALLPFQPPLIHGDASSRAGRHGLSWQGYASVAKI